MALTWNRERWRAALGRPDWYSLIGDDLKLYLKRADELEGRARDDAKAELYDFFETALDERAVALAISGKDWDAERKPIDTAVVHHTSQASGISWQRLSAIHLIRLYVPEYQRRAKRAKAEPIFSNHFQKDGRQVFYAYHWLVRTDGSTERLLGDDQIGWQAGDWEINRRSIAICFDDDLEQKSPGAEMLDAAARLISGYRHDEDINVLGHNETNRRTTCPGEAFLPEWKQRIIDRL